MINTLFTKLATHIGANTSLTFKTGAYSASDYGIVTQIIPANPDKIVVLVLRPVTTPVEVDDDVFAMQVRIRGERGDLLGPSDVSQELFELLHGIPHLDLDGLVITGLQRHNSMPLGLDANERFEISDNYQFSINQPIPNRP